VVRRPRDGWVTGLLDAGIVVILRLLTVAVALAALAGITAALWQAGQARMPLLVLVYGFVAVAGCGFALGRSGRLLTWSFWRPERTGPYPWEPRAGRARGVRASEQDDPVIVGPFGSAPQEGGQ
jgi:hypothetical protein